LELLKVIMASDHSDTYPHPRSDSSLSSNDDDDDDDESYDPIDSWRRVVIEGVGCDQKERRSECS
jgi:hypothetical protein